MYLLYIIGCNKSSQSSTEYCVKHGGGRTCLFDGCPKVEEEEEDDVISNLNDKTSSLLLSSLSSSSSLSFKYTSKCSSFLSISLLL